MGVRVICYFLTSHIHFINEFLQVLSEIIVLLLERLVFSSLKVYQLYVVSWLCFIEMNQFLSVANMSCYSGLH